MNSTVPLDEALPWSPGIERKVLVCDSIETDGRFLLHTMAKQILASNNQVLWVTCSPITTRQVATSLKKIGCDMAAVYLRDPSKSKNLTIRSLTMEISNKSLEDPQFDAETYLKDVYGQLKQWIREQDQTISTPCWIFLDDVSSLASILGDRLVYCFLDSLFAFSARLGKNSFGMIVRCSQDLDQTLTRAGDEEKDNTGWVGAGGLAHRQKLKENQRNFVPWERSIGPVDTIVDVIPLISGYSREAHGRLVFSECPGGRGWGDSSKQQPQSASWNKLVINYSLNDNGVRAIRLRA